MYKVIIKFVENKNKSSIVDNEIEVHICKSVSPLPNGMLGLELKDGSVKMIPVHRILEVDMKQIKGE